MLSVQLQVQNFLLHCLQSKLELTEYKEKYIVSINSITYPDGSREGPDDIQQPASIVRC